MPVPVPFALIGELRRSTGAPVVEQALSELRAAADAVILSAHLKCEKSGQNEQNGDRRQLSAAHVSRFAFRDAFSGHVRFVHVIADVSAVSGADLSAAALLPSSSTSTGVELRAMIVAGTPLKQLDSVSTASVSPFSSEDVVALTRALEPLAVPFTSCSVPASCVLFSSCAPSVPFSYVNDCEDDDDNAVAVFISLPEGKDVGQRVSEFCRLAVGSFQELGLISCLTFDGGLEAIKPWSVDDAVSADDSWPTEIMLLFSSGAKSAPLLTVGNLTKLCAQGATLQVVGGVGNTMAQVLRDAAATGFSCKHIGTQAGFVVHPGLIDGGLILTFLGRGNDTDSDTLPFFMRYRGGTRGGEPTALVFREGDTARRSREGADRSGILEENDVLNIPLQDLMRKLAGRGPVATEYSALTCLSQWGRLCSLRDDIAVLNDFHTAQHAEADVNNSEVIYRIEAVCNNLSSFGYTLPSAHARVVIDGLEELCDLIESAWSRVLGPAKQSISDDGTVEYLGLLQHYHIGDIVYEPATVLGSTLVAYRVCDVYYDTVRSMLGGSKLSFHIALECLIHLGDAFAFVSFDEIISDWEGSQFVANLPYIHADTARLAEFRQRGQQLVDLGMGCQYRQYRPSCFFAHGARSGSESSSKIASAGRMVVDTVRGLALGHNPAPGFEPPCLAIQAVVKAYRSVQRSMASAESLDKRNDRIKAAGLRLLDHVPRAMTHLCWPAVVGFGLNVKRWGHVLVEGLSDVKPNRDAWNRLVIPETKKELLLSLVERAFDPNAPRLLDLVANKGSGSLFLLHGGPGTGKTLTVEALSERFGIPLYSLTFGELGTSVSELEATMGEVLSLCSGWGALVLLDEGDALVERRTRGALLLNSMVGVLLKSLDAFEGLLFITTNRVASFDPAALSRVTLAIRYGSLKAAGRAKVWRNVLERAGANVDEFDIERLAQREGSGRDINAAARLALALSHHRQVPLSQSLFQEVLDIMDDFQKDFAEGLKPHCDGGRVSDDEN